MSLFGGGKEIRAAQADLAEVSERDRQAGVTTESDEFLAANRRVVDAEQNATPVTRWLNG